MRPQGYDTWDEVYRNEAIEDLPWFHDGLDPDFQQTLDTLGIGGKRALDIGCGPGTQAIALAERGYEVVATDISEAAIAYARARAEGADAEPTFVVDDFLETTLEDSFDLIFDRGVFHVFDPGLRERYRSSVERLLRPGGFLMLKCFSHHQPGEEGPHRIHPDELMGVFQGYLAPVALYETRFEGGSGDRPHALLAVYQRPA